MLRLRALFPPLALLLLLAGAASAAPLSPDRENFDRAVPAPHIQSARLGEELRSLPRVRLFLAEVTILPSGRMVSRAIPVLPLREGRAAPIPPDLIVLPLPAAMPLLVAALAGLAIAGRRRRGRPLAEAAPRS